MDGDERSVRGIVLRAERWESVGRQENVGLEPEFHPQQDGDDGTNELRDRPVTIAANHPSTTQTAVATPMAITTTANGMAMNAAAERSSGAASMGPAGSPAAAGVRPEASAPDSSPATP